MNYDTNKKRKSINYHGIGFYSTIFLFDFCFKNKSVKAKPLSCVRQLLQSFSATNILKNLDLKAMT
ncbi:hypothetical protein H8356DRAFT_1429913 [Neocallimastix lanati (nom. inval.)]|nr:hypothetical protein H8356DRAFT_1429913 [Neocallimastix sp. JGI-2020a]